MDKLLEARAEIDAVDREMAALFCRRMDAVRAVAAYKMEHGLPVLDAAREEQVVQKNLALLGEKRALYGAYYEDLLRREMALSRAMQRRMLGADTVAYQGVEGAFSHIALKRLFPHSAAKSLPTWADVFDEVSRGDAAYGVLPFKNSSAGDVSEVLDLCFAHSELYVWDVYDLPVRQNLLGVAGARLSYVRTVLSHQQALWQCAPFLKRLGAATAAVANTAAAAKQVAEKGDASVAAIASRETAQLYSLSVLAEDVNESAANTTRFIVIAKQRRAAGDRFSLLFTVDHRAGALARIMRIIGEEGFNLESIKSRPMPGRQWEYYFYAEVVGDVSEQGARALLEQLEAACRTVRVLGVYRRGSCEG